MAPDFEFAFPPVRIEAGRNIHAGGPYIMQPLNYESYKFHFTSLCFFRVTNVRTALILGGLFTCLPTHERQQIAHW